MDTGFNQVGRRALREFLARVATERVGAVEDTFALLEELESRRPFRLNDSDAATISGCHESLQELLDYLGDTSGGLTPSSLAAERARVREYVRVMWQWTEPGFERSRHVGENLVQILERERPDTKMVAWAANVHIGRRMIFQDESSLGDVAADAFGDSYRPFALEFGDGRFQTRTLTADSHPSKLVETVMTPPPAGSLPWYLSEVGLDVFAVDTRSSTAPHAPRRWLTTELPEHGCMWYYTEPSTLYHDARVTQHYDGLFFVEHITAAHPTTRALQGAALGESH